MDRINRLRNLSLNNGVCIDDFYYKFYKHYTTSHIPDDNKRYTEAYYYAFDTMTPSISDDELIVGKYSQLTPEELTEWKEKYSEIVLGTLPVLNAGQDSHMAIDYELILKYGINGIIEKIDNYISLCSDESKLTFYNTCKLCLNAVIKHAQNYSDKAAEMAKSSFEGIANLANSLKNVVAIHFEPYHPLGITKSINLGRTQKYSNKDFLAADDIEPLADCIRKKVHTDIDIL